MHIAALSSLSACLPLLLFAFAPLACGGDNTSQSSAAGPATGSGASAAMGSGGAGASGSGGAAGSGGMTGSSGAAGSGGIGGSTGVATGGAGPGSGGAGPAASSGAGGAGGSMGTPCTGMGGCDPGMYCNAPGCGAGVCAPQPGLAEQQQDKALVCGCDGVTYWNESIAAYRGVSVKAMGACPVGSGIACSQAMPCPSGLRCNRKAPSQADCTTTATGECWGVPFSCGLTGPQGHACLDMSCQTECALIQSQNPWYDGACP